jgi:hypothetical protein
VYKANYEVHESLFLEGSISFSKLLEVKQEYFQVKSEFIRTEYQIEYSKLLLSIFSLWIKMN